MFHIVEDAYCIYRKRGIYKQSNVYSRNGYLYTNQNGGFSKLKFDSFLQALCTTCPDTIVESVENIKYQQESITGYLILEE